MTHRITTYLKKSCVALIVIAVVVPISFAYMPRQADAQAVSLTKCLLQYTIFSGLSGSLELPANAFNVPVHDFANAVHNAQGAGNNSSQFIKDCIERGLALAIGKFLLAQMTDQLVQWINGGFQGSPLFATDPGGFLVDIADQIAGEFIVDSGLGALCSPFQLQLKIALLFNYNYHAQYSGRSACTLSKVVQNVENFYRDFTKGGWGAWFSMNLNPQNNAYGAYLEATSELSAQIGNQKIIENQKLDWGGGFFSYEECDDGTVTWGGKTQNNTEGNTSQGRSTSNAKGSGITLSKGSGASSGYHGECSIKTPGKTIAGTLDSQFGVPATQLGLADDLDKILNALANQLMQQFLGAVGGLLGSASGGANRANVDNYLRRLEGDTRSAESKAAQGIAKANSSSSQTNGSSTSQTAGNLTFGATVSASNPRSNGVTYGNLVDGDKVNDYGFGDEPKFEGAATNGTNPWLEIDLGRPQTIGRVVVYERNTIPTVAVKGNLTYKIEIRDKDKNLVWTSPESVPMEFKSVPKIFEDIPAVTGQFVRIQATGTGALHIAELEVYPYQKPTITLNGSSLIQTKIGESFTDPGARAVDNDAEDISALIQTKVEPGGQVNTTTSGSYTVTYTVTDKNNASASVTRQVQVLP